MVWPPATYDVISRNNSNLASLNLSQKVREGWTNSYWKRQVLMFYLPEKTQNLGGGGGGEVAATPRPPPPPLVRPMFNKTETYEIK